MTKRLAEMNQPKYIGLVNENKSHFNGVASTWLSMGRKVF
jgi:hypothetical protein